MNAFVRRILSGLLVLAGGSQVGCNPFRPCLSIAAPREQDAQDPGRRGPMHACLSPPMEPCLSFPMEVVAPGPDASTPAPQPQLRPCLSMLPPPPAPTSRPDASSEARPAADAKAVLAGLADRLPDDVKARLGLADSETPKKV